MPGLNDSGEHLDVAYELAKYADATVFTGLFYRDEIAEYYKANGLPEPYEDTARRKIVPETLERRVLAAFDAATPLFRKTSCAVSYVHGLPDYNGHYGIRELCDICPLSQLELCAARPPRALIRASFRKSPVACPKVVVWWSWTSPSARLPYRGWRLSSLGTTCSTRLGSRFTTCATPTMSGGMVAPASDGRTVRKVADWTSLTYVAVDVEGNGEQPPDLVELAAVPIVAGVVEEPASWLVKPKTSITHVAARIHGLTNDDVADARRSSRSGAGCSTP